MCPFRYIAERLLSTHGGPIRERDHEHMEAQSYRVTS